MALTLFKIENKVLTELQKEYLKVANVIKEFQEVIDYKLKRVKKITDELPNVSDEKRKQKLLAKKERIVQVFKTQPYEPVLKDLYQKLKTIEQLQVEHETAARDLQAASSELEAAGWIELRAPQPQYNRM